MSNRCRLFIDEVGNGGLKVNSANPNERYLSLSGIVTRVDLYDSRFNPRLLELKRRIFGAGGDRVVFHRREIVRREGPFSILKDLEVGTAFDSGLLRLFRELPYLATTTTIDKSQHIALYGEWTKDPYDYCLQSLIERYILWMNRHSYVGDVVIESRDKKSDKRVKKAFRDLYDNGTLHIRPRVMQACLTSGEIKFAIKQDNCPAMQVVDLLAHPSFRAMKLERLGETQPDDFGSKVVDILERWKYARHPKTHNKDGWGKKWLPK